MRRRRANAQPSAAKILEGRILTSGREPNAVLANFPVVKGLSLTMKTSTKELLHQLNDPNLSNDERAKLRCRVAKRFEDVGNYDAARDALGELWGEFGESPRVET